MIVSKKMCDPPSSLQALIADKDIGVAASLFSYEVHHRLRSSQSGSGFRDRISDGMRNQRESSLSPSFVKEQGKGLIFEGICEIPRVENMEVCQPFPSQPPKSSSFPSCSLELPLPVVRELYPRKSKPSSPKEDSNLLSGSQGDTVVSPSSDFLIDGLSPRKMAKVHEVLCFLDIKVYSKEEEQWLHSWNARGLGSRNKRRVVKDFLRSENPEVVMIQKQKRRSVTEGLWVVSDGRNKDWVALPACRALGEVQKIGGSSLTSSMRDFDSFIRECELLDPPLRNASFTWSNLQESPVCKRLDRFLYSNEWGQLFPQGLQEALIRRTSDHWPIVLDTNPFMWGPTPFRFENMWLQHPSFKENFRNWWSGFQGNGWEGHKFMRRLQLLKPN
ncbi:hypothetical protein CK203_060647 [Vitis vinifera]|uniref:Endonuclease/exonuclease/phosphatase domain-containing protein n=1 Tax=Vitis vinifera TaxID=29760 RepID=A0A438GEG5_VITVI|nr:hypothetical protein CK203_060647 [Vitis vinifera]